MKLDRYISKNRIIELQSNDLRGALEELVDAATFRLQDNLKRDELVNELLQRENTMTTYLGNGVAMPHIRVNIKRPYIFALGRCPNGLIHDGLEEYKSVRIVIMQLASEGQKNYLNVLASLARLFRQQEWVDQLIQVSDLEALRNKVLKGFSGEQSLPERKQSRFNRLLLKDSQKIARAARCSHILLFTDSFVGGIDHSDTYPEFPTILVTRSVSEQRKKDNNVKETIELHSFSSQRLSQIRSAIIVGLTRGLFKYNDRLCCIGGIPASNQLDTVVVIDIEREFHTVIARENDLLPGGVHIEVVERMLAVATEIAVEGREGHPVGCMFVLGDHVRVNAMVKPLVLNPFQGHKDEDKNVLNPFMDETIKEFSVIDGCFVIRGDGVIQSAGSLIHVPSEFYQDMPGGFGARHSAAAAVTRAAECLSIVVSASTGQVTLFRRGVMLPLLDKPIGSTY